MEFLIRQLLKGMGIFVRTIKAFFKRRVSGASTRFRQLTNVSRGAVQAANSAVQSAVDVTKPPSKREDYIAFGNLLIAKSLLARIFVGAVVLGMVVYFLLWPWILSHFLTARFWAEDKRVPDWTGRVIVYADKKKTVPLYAGRVEKGLLQGEGKQYDGNGVLSYEGAFLSGVKSGAGTAYLDGVLCYEGQFSQDLYEGTGTSYTGGELEYEGQFSAGQYHGRGTLYQDGSLLYDGQFDRGIYQGQGSLYQAGTLSYQGAFQDGSPEGMGTSYYYGGGIKYQGQFEKGVPEGTGKAYEDGRLVYQGSFSRGIYNGTGILYPVQGEQLEASFLDGEPDGMVRWSKGGKLYYEGEWSDGRPEGYGVLYDKAGTAVYQGAFAWGAIDGGSLLDLNVEDLRRVLGEDNTRNTAGRGNTFSVSSARLGLTAQCTYQTASSASRVTAVYLYEPEDGDGWFRLLPGMDRSILPEGAVRRGTLAYTRQDAVPLASGEYNSAQLTADGRTESVIYQRNAPALVRWTGVSGGASDFSESARNAGSAGSAATAAEIAAGVTGMDAVEDLLAALDGMAAVPAAIPPVEYGDAPVGGAIAACQSAEDAADLLGAMSDFWLQAETERLLAENLGRVEALLADAKREASMGQGDSGTVSSLEAQKQDLEEQILKCEMEKEKASMAVRSVTGDDGADPAQWNLSETAVMFNPSGMDVAQLPVIASAYAQATGGGTDNAALEVSVKSALLNLQEKFDDAQSAMRQYEEAAKAADAAAQQFAMGTGTKAAWYKALSDKNSIRSNLYSSMNAFTKQSADLNAVTGGWVSRSMDWHKDAFGSLAEAQFQASGGAAQERPSAAAESTAAESAAAESAAAESAAAESTPAESAAAESAAESAAAPVSTAADTGTPQDTAVESTPAENAAAESAAAESVAAENAPTGSVAAESAAAENAPTESTAAESAAAENAPTESTAAESAAAENAPTESTAAESAAAENAPTESTAAESAAAENAPTESTAAESAAAENAPTESTAAESAAAASTTQNAVGNLGDGVPALTPEEWDALWAAPEA